MLFNSYTFLIFFLPVTLAGYLWLCRHLGHRQGGARLALGFLVAASLVYYGWWNPWNLGLILGSMGVNFGLGWLITRSAGEKSLQRLLLAFGIALNLACLGYYKYTDFAIANLNAWLGTTWPSPGIILPIGISFFTFQQIAYLVDTQRGLTREHDWLHYALFVTFFPQLIAGPIVHHQEMMPQFRAGLDPAVYPRQMSLGLTFLAFGLAKKLLLADPVAISVAPVFEAEAMSLIEAWIGALAYTFQLYFDFSAYSDMAIGLGLLFGLRLPLNFASPYRALNIIEFWRRWHMTLARFLRDYLYIPLGGNRRGPGRRYANLMVTMLLGGIWHGAGWTFLIWGGLHGLFLVLNHGWRSLRQRQGWWVAPSGELASTPRAYRILAWCLTLSAVVLAWVPFRAADWPATLRLWRSMLDPAGFRLPEQWAGHLQPLGLPAALFERLPLLSERVGFMLILLALVAFAFPNTQQILRYEPARPSLPGPPTAWYHWRPNWAWALLTAGLLAAAFLQLSRVSEFLYFQF